MARIPECPVCKRTPDIGLCEPWPRSAGPQPWHAGCYSTNPVEHYIGDNGDTRAEAVANWRKAVAAHQIKSTS